MGANANAVSRADSVATAQRNAIGWLLFRLLYYFRAGLLDEGAQYGYGDLREAHVVILGNVSGDGRRLTEIAGAAHLSLATTSEFVTELEHLGYLERRPDPTDGRAKLIFPTRKGRRLLRDAQVRVRELEEHWASIVGPREYQRTIRTMQKLLDAVEEAEDR